MSQTPGLVTRALLSAYPTAPGDVWETGGHRFLCADFREAQSMGWDRRLLAGEVLDEVVVDLPRAPGLVASSLRMAGRGVRTVNYRDLLLRAVIFAREVAPRARVVMMVSRRWADVAESWMHDRGVQDVVKQEAEARVNVVGSWEGQDVTRELRGPALVLGSGAGVLMKAMAAQGRRTFGVEVVPERLVTGLLRVASSVGSVPRRVE